MPKDPTKETGKEKKAREAAEKAARIEALALVPPPQPLTYVSLKPSNIKSLAICPQWLPEPRDDQNTTAADEGTLLHEAVETRDFSKLNEDQVKLAQKCLDFLDNIVIPEFVATYSEGEFSFVTETKLNVASLTRGIGDLLLFKDYGSVVVDWKFGFLPTDDVEWNWQAQAYVIGVFYERPWINHCKVYFVAPKRDEVSVGVYHRSDYAEMLGKLTAVIARKELPADHREYVMNPGNCLYCGNKVGCRALDWFSEQVAQKYLPEELPDFNLRPSETMDGVEWSRKLAYARVMKKWSESVIANATQYATAGNDIDGWYVAERKGARALASDSNELLVDFLQTEYKFTMADLVKLAKLNLADVENWVAAQAVEGETQTTTKVKLSEALSDLGLISHGGFSYYLKKSTED